MKRLIAFIFTLLAVACTNSNQKFQTNNYDSIARVNDSLRAIYHDNLAQEDPYYTMSIAFEGYPEEEEIKSLMEAVLKKYKIEQTNKNRLAIGSVLVTLRKESVIGVTEMDILKHIYQKGSPSLSIQDQAALSFTILESSK